ncbi:MAG: hypothetical protein ACRDL9_06405, partial [Trebonia sp.]
RRPDGRRIRPAEGPHPQRLTAGMFVALGAHSSAALSMITKEKHPMRALFFRDHEISGLGAAGALRKGAITARSA